MSSNHTTNLVELTRDRLQNLRRKQSLQLLVMQYVVENIEKYTKQNLMASLAIQIREEVLQRLLLQRCWKDSDRGPEEFDRLINSLPQLLSKRTVAVDLSNLFTFCPKDRFKNAMVQVCDWVARFALNIKELVLSHPRIEVVADERLMDSLLSLGGKLRKLQLCCKFSIADLQRVCRALPGLRVASVSGLAAWPGDERRLAEDLRHLRVLEDDDWRTDLIPVLARLAPHLDYIDAWHWGCLAVPPDQQHSTPPTLLRSFLHLHSGEAVDAPDQLCEKLPNISHMTVSGSFVGKHHVECLLAFTKMKALALNNCSSWCEGDRLISALGQNLQTLDIMSEEPLNGPTFHRILQCCPRLERLSLQNIVIPDAPCDAFPHLREFSWKNEEEAEGLMAVGSVLTSPKLHKVMLMGTLKVKDLQNLTSTTKQGEVLLQLQTLHLDLVHTIDPDYNYRHFKAASLLLQTASAFLPLLTDIHLAMLNDCVLLYIDHGKDQVVYESFRDEVFEEILQEYGR